MGGVFATSAARVASGIGLVACAAIVAFAIGGGGVFGGLGGVFGTSGRSLEVARARSPAADIVAAPAAAGRLRNRRASHPAASQRTHAREQPGGRRPGSEAPGGVPPRAPSTPPPLQPPSVPSPAVPSPGNGQTVANGGDAIKQATDEAPPPLQPVTQKVNDAIDTVVQTCRDQPVCP